MTLEEFKYIFYYEYWHRMLGRLIGFAFLVPAGYFAARGWFNRRQKIFMGAVAALICAQGLMGWYMVKSGLDEQHPLMQRYNTVPRVSQYRLASHLGLAFMIYSATLWSYLDIKYPKYGKEVLGRLTDAQTKLLKKLR